MFWTSILSKIKIILKTLLSLRKILIRPIKLIMVLQ